jgi:hypothetical protein
MISSSPIAVQDSRFARGRLVLIRFASILAVAFAVGWMLHRGSDYLESRGRQAGFGQGLLQGALMPMTLPNLLVGNEVAIYSSNNTGWSYKLGYTSGVNACGALFFGYQFWRINRWRKRPPGN